jgi:membrane-associated protease RseP (regulator of RpoE activity)
MDWYTISILVFVLILVVIFYKDRKNVQRQSILLIRRTQRGKKGLINLGRRFPRFWKGLGIVAVIFSFMISIYIVYFLVELIGTNFLVEKAVPGISFVLPALGAETVIVPGAILVPFWYWIIIIALLVVVHEGLHGIMAAMERVKIKSMGWGLFIIIPLAFVEPDEKQLEKKPAWSQLRVFASGSFANFILAGFSLLLIASMSGMFYSSGVTYRGLMEGYPAEGVNLSGTIVGINDYEINGIYDLRSALSEIGENQSITITTTKGEFALTTAGDLEPVFKPSLFFVFLAGHEHGGVGTIDFFMGTSDPQGWTETKTAISMWGWVKENVPGLEERANERILKLESKLSEFKRPGFIGIASVSSLVKLNPGLEGLEGPIVFIQGLLFWLFLINFGVGAANLLPIGPLDGGRMWGIVIKKVAKKRWKKIMSVVSYATLAIFIINFLFWFGL